MPDMSSGQIDMCAPLNSLRRSQIFSEEGRAILRMVSVSCKPLGKLLFEEFLSLLGIHDFRMPLRMA